MLILNGSLKAYFNDGYIIDEEKQSDKAILVEEKNSLGEILFLIDNPRVHGKLTKLICRIGNDNIEINWKVLPPNSRPIRIRNRYSSIEDKITNSLGSIEYGYEYVNNVGKNIKMTKIHNINRTIQ